MNFTEALDFMAKGHICGVVGYTTNYAFNAAGTLMTPGNGRFTTMHRALAFAQWERRIIYVQELPKDLEVLQPQVFEIVLAPNNLRLGYEDPNKQYFLEEDDDKWVIKAPWGDVGSVFEDIVAINYAMSYVEYLYDPDGLLR